MGCVVLVLVFAGCVTNGSGPGGSFADVEAGGIDVIPDATGNA
jgi:hypothetical protein